MGFALLKDHPERVASLVNGAGSPDPMPEGAKLFAAAMAASDVANSAQGLRTAEGFIEYVSQRNDMRALAASVEGLIPWVGPNLTKLDVPSFHYVGENDHNLAAVKKAASQMPGAEFMLVPGVDHLQGFARAELALPAVREFLKRQAGV